jgi:ketosteroid isomerase-like protein
MTERVHAALHDALALMRAPRGPRPSPHDRLPDGMSLLLRLVAGEEEASALGRAATSESTQTLREAAIFYIQQVCFAPGSTSYRVLGVEPDASDERIREHYRWLARWLHPDRNPDPWEVVFAERVGQAWQELRTPERRQRYVATQEDIDDWDVVVSAQPVHRAAPAQPREIASAQAITARDLRWVPSAIVASLAASALLLVVVFYASRPRPVPAPSVASYSAEPATPPSDLPARAPVPVPAALPAPLAVAQVPVDAPPAIAMSAPPPAPVAAPPQAVPEPARVPAPRMESKPPEKVVVAAVEAARPRLPKVAPTAVPAAVAARATPAGAALSTAEAPAPVVATMDAGEANQLLGNFSRAYKEGDLQGMRALFADDARGPRGGLDSILSDYDRVFSDTRKRSLDVRNVNVFQSGDTYTIVASFEATVTSERSGRARRSHGDLRIDLRRQGRQWQIYRMQHDEDPG